MIDPRIFKVEIREGKERTIKSYVLRNNVLDEKGEKALTEGSKYLVYFEDGKTLDSPSLFSNSNPFVIEIGFGMGNATLEIAKEKSDVNYLGLEVYLDGVVKLVKRLNEEGLKNLKVMRFNAVDVLEHMVDTVLYFEGESRQNCRVIRAMKNRFGSTNELGVFEMTDAGLREVESPSELLLADRPEGVSGNCAVCVIEGTRPLVGELQALATPTVFPSPRRMSTGIDYNRVSLVLAVLENEYAA